MKPRTSLRSRLKASPDKESGSAPHAPIPEWAKKASTRVGAGDDSRPTATHSRKSNLNRPSALDRLSVTQQLRRDSVPLSSAHPALPSTQGDGRQNSEPSDISAVPRHGDSEPLLTVGVTANLLAVSEKTVRRLIGRGVLATVRVGRSVRIRPEVLAAYIDGIDA